MPIPIFFLQFREQHGRNPRPEELSTGERRVLLSCCLQNIERDAEVEAAIREVERQIDALRKYRETLLSQKPDTEKWHLLIEDCVGLRPLTDEPS